MTLVIFLLILSVLVLVHELGHFVMAKKAGILVEEFGFGLPPRLWGKKIGETVYSINLLPIGGFVKLHGEDALGNDKLQTLNAKLHRAFFVQSKKVRLAVLSAGVVMNFLLGVVLFSAIYSRLGIPTSTQTVRVLQVLSGSPAEMVGIKPDEVVMAVENEPIKSTERFIELTSQFRGKEMEITLIDRQVIVVPRENPPQGEGALGVMISTVEMKKFPWWQMPFRGAWVGLKEAGAWGVTIVSGVVGMLSRLITTGEAPKDVAGPIGILALTGSVKQAGVWALLQFTGVLSVNLAVLNLLPVPALDGGRLAFLAVEVVTRRKFRPGMERWVHAVGMALLLGLMVIVTVNDVVRISGAGSIWGLIDKLWVF